ncbi:hypothetical protein DB347_22705 [Opitutaceae bacterium EW11]|nr:hypothetical protein DB347_22705 [Opitutaceae bacterium EW11]
MNRGMLVACVCLIFALTSCTTPDGTGAHSGRFPAPAYLSAYELDRLLERLTEIEVPAKRSELAEKLNCDFEARHLGRFVSYVGTSAVMHLQLTKEDSSGRYFGLNLYWIAPLEEPPIDPTISKLEAVWTHDPHLARPLFVMVHRSHMRHVQDEIGRQDRPNKSLQPTATAVMPPAGQEARQP